MEHNVPEALKPNEVGEPLTEDPYGNGCPADVGAPGQCTPAEHEVIRARVESMRPTIEIAGNLQGQIDALRGHIAGLVKMNQDFAAAVASLNEATQLIAGRLMALEARSKP